MRTRSLLVMASTLTLLAGCAAAGTADSAAPSGSGATSAAVSPGTSAPVSPGTAAPSVPEPSGGLSAPPGKAPSGQPITVTGTVDAGAEARCLVLRTDGPSYLLLGGDPAVVRAGARLRVTGVVRTDVMSYCMQGIPLQVTRAEPA